MTASDVDLQADRRAIATLIKALYAAISGPAGPRDWPAHSRCFHPFGRQMRTGVDANGAPWMTIMDPAAYAVDAQQTFDHKAFYERELACRIDILGNMAHAWSLYEARSDLSEPQPERRGVNSIQFFRDVTGDWKIVSMIWDNERPGVAVSPF